MADPRAPEVFPLTSETFAGQALLSEEERVNLRTLLNALAEVPPIKEITANYTLTATDDQRIIEVDPDGGTVAITLPASLRVGFIVQVRQIGTGTTQLQAGSGATLNHVAGLGSPIALSGQWAAASVEVRAEDAWLATGQLV